MQNFQTAAGKAYSFDDDVKIVIAGGISKVYTATGEQITNAPADLTPCANNELPGPTAAQLWAAHQGKAREALARSDVTMARVTEAVIAGKTTFAAADVMPWASYRAALRAIVVASTGDQTQPLPTQPAYPVGT